MKYLTKYSQIDVDNEQIYIYMDILTILKTFFTTSKYLEKPNLVSYHSQIVIYENKKKCVISLQWCEFIKGFGV